MQERPCRSESGDRSQTLEKAIGSDGESDLIKYDFLLVQFTLFSKRLRVRKGFYEISEK